MIYFWLFIEFLKVGLFSFGGAYGMIPLIKEIVISHQWLDETTFYDLIGVCESTPGPIAVNMATFIGSTQAGFLGSLIASFAVILPSFLIILCIVMILSNLMNNRFVQRIFDGFKPVVIGLILSTGISLLLKLIGCQNSSLHIDFISIIIFLIIIIFYSLNKFGFKKNINSIWIILLGAILGLLSSFIPK